MDNMEQNLKTLQLEMLKMLKLVREICDKHDIKYSLEGGTLLGAVRHEGFIPWDDDLDIMMLRKDYDKFLEVWEIEKPNGYFLQNKNTESDYTRSFSKIRKEHTTFLRGRENPDTIHTGIFIDIFPMDRIPTNLVEKSWFYWDSLRYQLYCREFVPTRSNCIIKGIAKLLLAISNKQTREKKREKLYEKITKYNCNQTLPLVCIETTQMLRKEFEYDLFDCFTYLKFEDEKFMCIEKWDAYLKSWYGDYMKLPPKEKQVCGHRPRILNFEKDYHELEID